MKRKSTLMLLLLAFVMGASVSAQEPASAAEQVEKLKLQLLEVEAREAGLRERLQQLDESIKPENIERSLAGVGSTRPEELREARRRQLSKERDSVLAQLQTIEESRSRLESAVANAEAAAYQESARPKPTGEGQMMMVAGGLSQKVMFAGGGLVLLVLGGAGTLLYRRTRLR
jgi:TolA-binding protein